MMLFVNEHNHLFTQEIMNLVDRSFSSRPFWKA